MTAHAAARSFGIPSERAKSLPRPPGRTASSAPGWSRRTPPTQPTSPSPPSVTVTSPARAARAASSRACSRSRVISVWKLRPSARSASSTRGRTRAARPPPAAGLQSRARWRIDRATVSCGRARHSREPPEPARPGRARRGRAANRTPRRQAAPVSRAPRPPRCAHARTPPPSAPQPAGVEWHGSWAPRDADDVARRRAAARRSQRLLLTTDGTVTTALATIAGEPVGVRTLSQDVVALAEDDAELALWAGGNVLERRVLLHGADSGTPLLYGASRIVAHRLPRPARDALVAGGVAIGLVLRAHEIETFRAPLSVGVRARERRGRRRTSAPGSCASGPTRSASQDRPLMIVHEEFPAAGFGAPALMRVLVAGGGIGGLATALSLHAAGIDVEVVESARSHPGLRRRHQPPPPRRPRAHRARPRRGGRGRRDRDEGARLPRPLRQPHPRRAARARRRLPLAADLDPPRRAADAAAARRPRAPRPGRRDVRRWRSSASSSTATASAPRSATARPARCARSRPTCSSAPTASTRRSARSFTPARARRAGRASACGAASARPSRSAAAAR